MVEWIFRSKFYSSGAFRPEKKRQDRPGLWVDQWFVDCVVYSVSKAQDTSYLLSIVAIHWARSEMELYVWPVSWNVNGKLTGGYGNFFRRT